MKKEALTGASHRTPLKTAWFQRIGVDTRQHVVTPEQRYSQLYSCTAHVACGTSWAVLPFSKLNKIFFGYFDPENIYAGNENNNFPG